VRRRWLQAVLISMSLLAGTAFVAASLIVPAVLLLHVDDRTLNRWSAIGQALSPIGVFFSGIAFISIAVTLFIQRRELQNQREELGMTRQEQARSSEVTLRQLHTDVIKMAIEDPELLAVWPHMLPGVAETKKDHYCNLILNLQKVAYEAETIELAELRGALGYLMTSHDMYRFWQKARTARIGVTGGDEAEDFFTSEVDQAFAGADPPQARSLASIVKGAAGQWAAERRARR
jgi:hypothetical protein